VHRHSPGSDGDILVTEMSKVRRLSKLEYNKMWMSKRITQRDQVAILRVYEKEMANGGNRSDILLKLSEKYSKSERQIERYIQQARKERTSKREGRVSRVLVTDDRHRALMLHFEAIRKAINIWVENQRPPSAEELRDAWKGKLNAWGVTAEVTAGGHGSAEPTMEKHPLYDSLRHHLVPPLVKEDLWGKVGELIDLGLGFLSGATGIYSELLRVAEQRSSFDIIPENWQSEPATGITQDFVSTLYEHALGLTDCSGWTHSAWAALWPMTGGLIVTWVNEGVRLLQYLGLDPFIQETYWPLTGGSFMLPRHPRERIAYGDASLDSTCRVAFLLCFGTQVIATASSPEQLASFQEAHQAIMADCASWQSAGSLVQTRQRLDSLSHEVRTALESAVCETSFPGRCTRCP
jgi:hypothetical protein